MATRAPERGRLERGQVARVEVLATDATGVLARTEADPDPWPSGPFPPPLDRSRPVEGRLRTPAMTAEATLDPYALEVRATAAGPAAPAPAGRRPRVRVGGPDLREGAVIPMGPVSQWVGERPCDPLALVVAPFAADGHPSQVVLDAPAGVELVA